ncbi:MAG: MazG nucleotide pyrophosphohydrolase domain-containing protein [bacterium]
MDFAEFQQQIEATYGPRDRRRGLEGTFRRLVEEVGELARALRRRDPRALEHEIGDVLAWTVSVAALAGADAARAAGRYAAGCPKCGASPCRCMEDDAGAAGGGSSGR